jgi:hypothetical protein
MSKKRRLESLAQLGMLKDEDIKALQKPKPIERKAPIGWITLAVVEAITIVGLLALIWYSYING